MPGGFQEDRPIFLQIAEMLEDAILTGAFPEGEQVPSTTEISVRYQINPATALKGVNQLVEAGILHKRRGVGMFVSTGAIQQLRKSAGSNFTAPMRCRWLKRQSGWELAGMKPVQ